MRLIITRIACITTLFLVTPLWSELLDWFWINTSSIEEEIKKEEKTPVIVESSKPIQNALLSNVESEAALECHPEQLGAFPISEWRNSAVMTGFLSKTKKFISNHPKCFVHVDASKNLALWLAPFGFYSRFQTSFEENGKIQFRQWTEGFGSGLEFTILDPLIFGIEAGYSHSSLNWKKFQGKGHNNAIFMGPYFSILFSHGYLEGTLFGVGNFYEGRLKYCSETSSDIGHMSWNLGGRIEGGLDVEIHPSFSSNLSFHPMLRLDYLGVFENGYHQVKKHTSSYLTTILSFRFSKVIFCVNDFFLLPSIKTGWVNWMFLNSDSLKVREIGSYSVRGERKNQLLIGISLLGVQAKAIILGLEYEAFIGMQAPIHSVNLRLEWSW